MRVNIFSCLLALVLGCNVTAEILPKVVKEKKPVTLRCLHSVEGKVTWSRERDGNKVDILTADGDGETKHIHDPGRRYSSVADKSLHILSVTVSDAGTYSCNNDPAVRLSVIPSGHKTPPTTPPSPPTTRRTPVSLPAATTAASTPLANTGTSTVSSTQSSMTSTTYQKPLLGLVFGIAAALLLLLLLLLIIILSAGRCRSKRQGNEGNYPVYDEIQDESVGQPTNGGGHSMTTFAETSLTNELPYSLISNPARRK